jgi:hypothetical protein
MNPPPITYSAIEVWAIRAFWLAIGLVIGHFA